MNSNNCNQLKPGAGAEPARNEPRTATPQPDGLDCPTRIELAWARERAGMAIVVREHNWAEREEIEARKAFK